MNKIIKIVITILIIGLLIILFSSFFTRDTINKINKVTNNTEELYKNFNSFVNVNPKSDQLSLKDFEDGFWYRKKNGDEEDIFFFNTQEMINSGNSSQEIIKQIETLLSSSIIVKKDKMFVVPDAELPDLMEFYNKVLTASTQEFKNIKNSLLTTKSKTFSTHYNLAQIYSIENNLEAALKETKKACILDKKNEYCQKVKIKILNKNGDEIEILEVYRLQKNKYGFTVFSKDKEEYILPTKMLQNK